MTNEQWAAMCAAIDKGPGVKPGFAEWMKKVDALIVKRTGIGADDLPDFLYDDAFDDGASPSQAAKAAINAAKEF